MSVKVLSIFSGGGGIDCGFKKAGYDICFSTDFWRQNKFEKNYIYFVGDCVEFSVYLVLTLGVVVSVLILFLELGGLGVVLFLIFF